MSPYFEAKSRFSRGGEHKQVLGGPTPAIMAWVVVGVVVVAFVFAHAVVNPFWIIVTSAFLSWNKEYY